MTAAPGSETYNEYSRLKKQHLGESGNFGYTFFNSLEFIKMLSNSNSISLETVKLTVPGEDNPNLNPECMDANE